MSFTGILASAGSSLVKGVISSIFDDDETEVASSKTRDSTSQDDTLKSILSDNSTSFKYAPGSFDPFKPSGISGSTSNTSGTRVGSGPKGIQSEDPVVRELYFWKNVYSRAREEGKI